MGEIKRDDPHFDLQRFLKKLEKETIPMVMEAFLTDKLEPLEEICTERSMAVLGTIIKDRLKKGLKIDPTILDLDEVELREARLVDSEPVLIVTFQTQQVHCVRNNKGEITEGGESEIRQIFYVWAMMRHFSEDIADAPTWKLHEMAIQHQTPLLA
jgi:import inner membrane translocase subunit TIM44